MGKALAWTAIVWLLCGITKVLSKVTDDCPMFVGLNFIGLLALFGCLLWVLAEAGAFVVGVACS